MVVLIMKLRGRPVRKASGRSDWEILAALTPRILDDLFSGQLGECPPIRSGRRAARVEG